MPLHVHELRNSLQRCVIALHGVLPFFLQLLSALRVYFMKRFYNVDITPGTRCESFQVVFSFMYSIYSKPYLCTREFSERKPLSTHVHVAPSTSGSDAPESIERT